MNYNKNFNEMTRSYYDSQSLNKVLVCGYNCLNNAKLMKEKNMYYILVNYQENDILPKEYVPIKKEILQQFGFGKQDYFATVNPKIDFSFLIDNSAIKKITKVSVQSDQNVHFLIGRGSEVISTLDLIYEQLEAYKEKNILR